MVTTPTTTMSPSPGSLSPRFVQQLDQGSMLNVFRQLQLYILISSSWATSLKSRSKQLNPMNAMAIELLTTIPRTPNRLLRAGAVFQYEKERRVRRFLPEPRDEESHKMDEGARQKENDALLGLIVAGGFPCPLRLLRPERVGTGTNLRYEEEWELLTPPVPLTPAPPGIGDLQEEDVRQLAAMRKSEKDVQMAQAAKIDLSFSSGGRFGVGKDEERRWRALLDISEDVPLGGKWSIQEPPPRNRHRIFLSYQLF